MAEPTGVDWAAPYFYILILLLFFLLFWIAWKISGWLQKRYERYKSDH